MPVWRGTGCGGRAAGGHGERRQALISAQALPITRLCVECGRGLHVLHALLPLLTPLPCHPSASLASFPPPPLRRCFMSAPFPCSHIPAPCPSLAHLQFSFMGSPSVPRRLQTGGVYALLRHPQALGNMMFLIGECLLA